jgi:hypothetical protein
MRRARTARITSQILVRVDRGMLGLVTGAWPSCKIVGRRATSWFQRTSRVLTSAVAHFGQVRTLPSTRQLVRAQVLPELSGGCFQYVSERRAGMASETRSLVTAAPGGIWTDEVGVITGSVELRTERGDDGAVWVGCQMH